jgi:hypothetical protein
LGGATPGAATFADDSLGGDGAALPAIFLEAPSVDLPAAAPCDAWAGIDRVERQQGILACTQPCLTCLFAGPAPPPTASELLESAGNHQGGEASLAW